MININNVRISFTPSQQEINEIEKWLIEERNLTGEGFYCNWNNILSSFEENRLVIISYDNKTIGFASWKCSSKVTATILNVEIKPCYRKKGIGRELINKLFHYLKSRNIYTVNLQCSPATSEPVWRRCGFIDFPEKEEPGIASGKSNPRLYQTLVPQLNPTIEIGNNEALELWDMEPYQIKNTKPNMEMEFRV